ncbi:unnamed protein product [Polarella glacialis]|nr:unnamed protein product [Polarella glacialis]
MTPAAAKRWQQQSHSSSFEPLRPHEGKLDWKGLLPESMPSFSAGVTMSSVGGRTELLSTTASSGGGRSSSSSSSLGQGAPPPGGERLLLHVLVGNDRWESLGFQRSDDFGKRAQEFLEEHKLSPMFRRGLTTQLRQMVMMRQLAASVDIVDLF